MTEQLDAKLQYEEIREMMNRKNPIITQVIKMKELDGLSNEEMPLSLVSPNGRRTSSIPRRWSSVINTTIVN